MDKKDIQNIGISIPDCKYVKCKDLYIQIEGCVHKLDISPAQREEFVRIANDTQPGLARKAAYDKTEIFKALKVLNIDKKEFEFLVEEDE